jgi:hypothetical protein
VHPDGTGLRRVTDTAPGAGNWGSGSFSPDGYAIVNPHSPGVGAAGNADVYVMRLDGSHKRNIIASGTFASAPDWGPKLIALRSKGRYVLCTGRGAHFYAANVRPSFRVIVAAAELAPTAGHALAAGQVPGSGVTLRFPAGASGGECG